MGFVKELCWPCAALSHTGPHSCSQFCMTLASCALVPPCTFEERAEKSAKDTSGSRLDSFLTCRNEQNKKNIQVTGMRMTFRDGWLG